MNGDIFVSRTAKAETGNLSIPTSQNSGDLVEYLCAAYEAGSAVDYSRVDKKRWGLALEQLISDARLDVAIAVAPRMALAFVETAYFQTTAGLLAHLPPPCKDPSFASFHDDATQEVQIVPRADGNAVLLSFSGRSQKMGMPVNMVHRWFGPLGVHVIYLRDYQRTNYDNGIGSLAPDLPGTLRALREVIARLGTQRVVCYGNSMGSYGALRYALELQAEAVLTFAGPTNLSPTFGGFSYREKHSIAPGLDLRPLYQKAISAPRAHIVFGENQPYDRLQAQNFAGLPTVSLEMVRGSADHRVLLHSVFAGRFESLVRWLVEPNRGMRSP